MKNRLKAFIKHAIVNWQTTTLGFASLLLTILLKISVLKPTIGWLVVAIGILKCIIGVIRQD